ncbi:hypothetical protein [Collimonas sp. PA-H2]|uniref:hypothetical protein n=1 Tax=Collimonas sp. PA-H2 TaxID=1881062 RepID=UPI000BF9119D|nr:hypothetical protein [Collimonas sp. PA-H2]
MKDDDAEGFFPELSSNGLPNEAGATHIGMASLPKLGATFWFGMLRLLIACSTVAALATALLPSVAMAVDSVPTLCSGGGDHFFERTNGDS